MQKHPYVVSKFKVWSLLCSSIFFIWLQDPREVQTDYPRSFGAGLALGASRDVRGCGCEHRGIAQSHHQVLLSPALLLSSSRWASAVTGVTHTAGQCCSAQVFTHLILLRITSLKLLRWTSWKKKGKQYRKTLFYHSPPRYKQSVLSCTALHPYWALRASWPFSGLLWHANRYCVVLGKMDEIHLTSLKNWDTSDTRCTGGCCTWALKWFPEKADNLFLESIAIPLTQLTHEFSIRNYVKQYKTTTTKKPLRSIINVKKQYLRSLVRLESGKQQAVVYKTEKNVLYNLWIIWTAVMTFASKNTNVFFTKQNQKKINPVNLP